MDIVVTIPKSEYKNDDQETADYLADSDTIQFWTLAAVPKQLVIGERVYFIKNGCIESSMKVIGIETDSSRQCDTTGRTWSGKCQLFMDDLRKENFPQKIRGFQGFRYFNTVLKKDK